MPIASWTDIADDPLDEPPKRASFADIVSIEPMPVQPPAAPSRRATLADIVSIEPTAPPVRPPAFDPLEQEVIAASPATAARNPSMAGIFGLQPSAPTGHDIALPKPPPPVPLRPGRMAGLADTAPRSTTTTPQDLIGGALQVPIGALQALPAAGGEQLAGGPLPGHEAEPPTFFGRAWEHLKMTAAGKGGEVLPQGAITQAIAGNPADTGAAAAPTFNELLAKGPSAVGVNPKVQELARRGLGTAAKMLMDPIIVAIGAAPSSVAEASAVVFSQLGIESAVATATNPHATDVDVAEAVINALLMTAPVGAQALRQVRTRVAQLAEAARPAAEVPIAEAQTPVPEAPRPPEASPVAGPDPQVVAGSVSQDGVAPARVAHLDDIVHVEPPAVGEPPKVANVSDIVSVEPPTVVEPVQPPLVEAAPNVAHVDDVVSVEPPAPVSAEPAAADVAPGKVKREPKSVRSPAVDWDALTKQHQREVRRIMLEMEELGHTGKTFTETTRRGGDQDVSGRVAGAPVFWDIVGGNKESGRQTFGYSRSEVAQKLRAFVDNGKRSVVSDLAVDVAERRLTGDRTLQEALLPPDAGDEPGAVRVRKQSTTLDDERAAIQKRAVQAVENDTEQLAAAYREKFGNVVSADNAKELFPDYATKEQRGANDLAVHHPASRLAQHLYDETLKEPLPEGRDPLVVLTAGGTGSGKSSSLDVQFPGTRERAHVVYDSTLTDFDAAVRNIEAARDTGHSVAVVFTDREIQEAYRATLSRAEEHGRPVTVNTHVSTHTKAPEVFQRLQEHYPEGNGVDFFVVRNSTAGGRELVPLADWEPRRYNEADVRAHLERIRAEAGAETPRAGEGERGVTEIPGGTRAGDRGVPADTPSGRPLENARRTREVAEARRPQAGDRVKYSHGKDGEAVIREIITAGKPGGKGLQRQRERARINYIDPDTGRRFETHVDLDQVQVLGEPPAPVVDTLDTGEEQVRLPGAESARQAGKADTSFRAPAQASGDDFSLEAPRTAEQKAADAKRETGPSMFDDEPLSMPDRGKRADASGALVPSPASRALSLLKPGETQLRPSEIVHELSAALDALPVKVGKFRQHALGIYKPREQTIRLKVANDLDTLAHELGHHIHESLMEGENPSIHYRDELKALGEPTSRGSYTLKQKLQEGQAEFTRYYLSDPAEAQRLAPNYYRVFEAGLDRHPELQAVLQRVQRQYIGHLSLDPVERGLAHIDFDGGDPSPKTDVVTRLQTAWVDDLYPLRRMTEDLADHQPIDVTRDGYKLARLARGASAKADGFLRHGVRAADGTFIAPALEPALKPVRKQMREFVGYLAALRALELRDRGMETGMTRVEAQAIVNKFKAIPGFATARDAVYAFQDGMLRYARQAGTLSAEHLAAIRELNKAYVPFQRVIDDVGAAAGGNAGGVANKATPVKRIKGSGRDIVNPLESIVKNAHTLVALVEQNRAMRALVAQAESTTGGGRYLEAIPDKKVATSFNLSVLEGDIRKQLADHGVDLEHSNRDMFDKLVTVFTPTQFRMGEKGIVSVLKDGERKWYAVNDQALYDAIAAVGPKSSDLLVNMFMRPARYLRAGATTTLGFIARNPIRDTFEATVNSRYGFRLGYDTVRGLLEFAKKGEDYQNFLNAGGGNAAMVAYDRNRVRQELVKMGAAKRRVFADSLVLNPVNLLQALSEAMEHATRLGEFKRGVDTEGRTAEGYARAALAARDVTIDFARGGSVSKEINRYTAFFNATVQGSARLAEVFRRDPVGATIRATAAITVPSLALWAINQNDPEYRELPEWERNTYWHIPLARGVGHAWARVPKPFTLGQIFANVPEAALDYFEQHDPEALHRIIPDKTTAWHQLVSILPTAIMPAVEVGTNYDTFRDRAIVNPTDVTLDTALQYNRWTSDLAKFVGPQIGIPPAKLDHLIYGYGGGLARGVVDTGDRGLEALGIVARKKPAGGTARLPLVGTFYREPPGTDAQSLETFYRLRDRVEGAVGSIRRYDKSNEPDKQAARQDQARSDFGPDAGATLDRVRATDKALTDVRDDVNQVFANPRLEPDEKKELLDRLYERMVNLARRGLGKPELPSRFPKPPAPALLEKLKRPQTSAPAGTSDGVGSRPSVPPPAARPVPAARPTSPVR